MTTTLQDEEVDVQRLARLPRWLPLLEQELKNRLGWADQAISPFARANHQRRTDRSLPVVAKSAPVVAKPAQHPARSEQITEPAASAAA